MHTPLTVYTVIGPQGQAGFLISPDGDTDHPVAFVPIKLGAVRTTGAAALAAARQLAADPTADVPGAVDLRNARPVWLGDAFCVRVGFPGSPAAHRPAVIRYAA